VYKNNHMIISTATDSMFIHDKEGNTKEIKVNVDVQDIVVDEDDCVYAKGLDKHLYKSVLDLEKSSWEFSKVGDISDIKSITSSTSGDIIQVHTGKTVYTIRNGDIQEDSQTKQIYYGLSEDDNVEIQKNKVVVDDQTTLNGDIPYLTSDNRLFVTSSKKNKWIRKTVDLDDEPVFLSQGVCVVEKSTPRLIK